MKLSVIADIIPFKPWLIKQKLDLAELNFIQRGSPRWIDDLLHLLWSELNLKRDDCREFVELSLVFIGEEDYC